MLGDFSGVIAHSRFKDFCFWFCAFYNTKDITYHMPVTNIGCLLMFVDVCVQ